MTLHLLFTALEIAAAPVAVPAGVTSAAIARPADFRAEAEAMLQRAYRADEPGAAVVVVRGGEVLYLAGRGLADLETRRPITADTVFRLGSIVKQITAAAVLQLVAERRISLDDPISRFFPDLPPPAAAATVRQLLNHSSGIQDYTKLPGWIDQAGVRPWTTAELVAEAGSRPARSGPGESWEYNNAGYMMLGAILEQVTGKPWHEVIAERISGPLGLRSLTYGPTAQGDPALAQGHTVEESGPQPVQGAHMSVAHAAGGLVGSARDLAAWAQALHHGHVLSPELYAEMVRPARLADGSTRPYGFGLRLGQLRGRPALFHGGAGRGLDTDTIYLPSEDLFVAVLANSDDPATDPSILTRRLAALALGEPFPTFSEAEVPVAAIEPLFGAYRAPNGPDVHLFARDGRIYFARGEAEMAALPAGGDRFFFGQDRLVWVGFTRRPDGAHLLEVHEPDAMQPVRAVRTGPVPPPLTIAASVLRSYVGRYATEGPVVTVAIGDDGALTIRPADGQPMAMRPVSATEFRVDFAGFRVVFHPENGIVDRLTLHRGARELHGRRTGE